jgi:hypothetical protein
MWIVAKANGCASHSIDHGLKSDGQTMEMLTSISRDSQIDTTNNLFKNTFT